MGIVVSWKILMEYCAILKVLHRIFGSFLWDFVHLWKFLVGFFGSSSWDFVHFGTSSWDFVHIWQFLMGFCVFLKVPRGILCIFGNSSWQSIHVSLTLTGLMRRRRIIAFVWGRCPSLGLSQIIFMI
jgi:hypothetical protein